jgi:NADH-quinone oxidoreductase subunit F/NADP-reducing hydrogenase subunit HndC
MGTPLRELVETLAGGKYIKAVQVGGASGRVIPAAKLDITLAFESACVGAGAVMVFNDTRSAIELARQNSEFFAEESCGKCVPCREGTRVMLHLLSRIARGDGKKKDLGILKELSETMMLASLCGLGQAAPNSVVDTLEYFNSEYQESIAD